MNPPDAVWLEAVVRFGVMGEEEAVDEHQGGIAEILYGQR